MMPEMDGFEFISNLRKNKEWQAIPVIVVTAMQLTNEDRERLQGKVEAVLQKKPFCENQSNQPNTYPSITMSLFNYNTPFVTFDDIARVFDDALTAPPSGSQIVRHQRANTSFRPKVDVHEGPDNTVVASFELPGLKKEDVSIELHNNQLTISGEAKSTITEGDENSKYYVRERRFGKFTRSIPLPEGTQPDSVKAAVVDGVLTVTYPKATPEQSPKKITIQ